MSVLEKKSKSFQNKVQNAPLTPGVYFFLGSEDKPIYIGKAKILANRVKSYFNNFDKIDFQKQEMINQAEDIKFIQVDSEVEALILENNLIKKHQPKFNIMLRDDKNYIYVRFEKVRKANMKPPTATSVYQDFPRITITREKKDDGADYFGPFPSSTPVKRILRRIRKLFPYRTSRHLVYQVKDDPLEIYTQNPKPDLYYHLGLSTGVDAGLENKKSYVERFNKIKKFFKGEKNSLMKEYEKELKKAVDKLEFEKAADIRDKIKDLKYITSDIKLPSETDDVLIEEYKQKLHNNAVNQLVDKLDFPEDIVRTHPNFRIECYDISNIQGTNAVGSMTVMIDGQIKPRLYRRFKIKMKNEPNDFAMLQEVLTRRFKQFALPNNDVDIPIELKKRAKNWKKDESFSQIPDLIIIDGGKGQLASTYKILYKFGLHNKIPIVGLAKREEEIFKITDQFKDPYFNQINDSSMFTKVRLPKRSESLYLVQRIRDEAHRFAITYHRNLRSKAMLKE